MTEQSEIVTRTPDTLRQHLRVFVFLTILIVVMTFPTIVYVVNTDVFWLPTGKQSDAWMKFWDAWYGWRVLAGEADIRHTDLIFYPQGLSLRFHSFSYSHMLLFGGLQKVMPAANAFNLVYLLGILAVSLSAYLYLQYLFSEKRIALLGAVVVGMSPFVVGHPQNPDLGFIATIPLSLYCLHRGFKESRMRFIAASAVLTGLTAYIGLYIFVCLCLAVFMYLLYFSIAKWRDAKFWLALVLFAAIVGGALLPRAYTTLSNRQEFDESMEKWRGTNRGGDLYEYLVNARHPVLEPIHRQLFQLEDSSLVLLNTSYLGYTILVLIAIGFARRTYRRKMIPWLILMLPFLLLRLGSALTIKGREFPEILMPKRILDELAPGVFQAFHTVDHFHMGIVLPLAVLACYGAKAVTQRMQGRRRQAVIAVCIALVAFEYYQPVEERIVPQAQLAYLEVLETEPEPVRIINAPFGRGNSKYYLFYQSLSGFPQVEGLVSRTPESAYNYVKSNPILNQWRLNRDVICSNDYENGFGLSVELYLAALDQLEADGFSHVVFHPHLGHGFSIRKSFDAAEPTYSDDYVSVYRLDDLRASCLV